MQNCLLQSAQVVPDLPVLPSLEPWLPVRGTMVLFAPQVHLQNERGAVDAF